MRDHLMGYAPITAITADHETTHERYGFDVLYVGTMCGLGPSRRHIAEMERDCADPPEQRRLDEFAYVEHALPDGSFVPMPPRRSAIERKLRDMLRALHAQLADVAERIDAKPAPVTAEPAPSTGWYHGPQGLQPIISGTPVTLRECVEHQQAPQCLRQLTIDDAIRGLEQRAAGLKPAPWKTPV